MALRNEIGSVGGSMPSFPKPGIGGDRIVYVGPGPDGSAYVRHWPHGFVVSALAGADARCAELLQNATPPASCGPMIPTAPARGPMVAFTPRETVISDAGGMVRRHAGYKGRDAARAADIFDIMTDQARRAHGGSVAAVLKAHQRMAAEAKALGKDVHDFREPQFIPPFSHGQVAVARDYAALFERCETSGLKCSSLEAQRSQSGAGGDREAAVFRDFERLRQYHRRIGDGLAKEVRRIRPNGRKRIAIRARLLVDQVCIGGKSLDGVLEACGWAQNEKTRAGLRLALCAALDRMQGYDLMGAKKAS